MGSSCEGLSHRWREEAKTFRHRGADQQALLLESCACELELAIQEDSLESLTLREAADESGYSYSALQKMVARGELPNVGEKNKPLVRRGDLPRKPGRSEPVQENGEPDLAGTILANRD